MEHPKTRDAISKLKSSYSVIENKMKTENYKKKSKSNAEIDTLVELKKRGVYVQKNKTSMFGRDLDPADEMKEGIQERSPKRPHRDHKKFLASVLSILSKSSTVAQQQDSSNNKSKKDEYKHKTSSKHTLENIPSLVPSYFDLDKKRKYRSKILNGYKRQCHNFEVLQTRKERFATSSSSSSLDKEDTKWKSDLPRLVPPSPDEIKDDDKYKTLVREVTEGKKLAEKKNKVFDPDPATLVAEQSSHRDDNKLYDFFVDLLQNTFNDYDVNTNYNKGHVASTVSSKIALEIDESVARKLNVATDMHKQNERQKPIDYSIKSEREHRIDNNLQNNTHYTRTSKNTRVNRETPKSASKQTKTRKANVARGMLSSRSQNIEYYETERPSFYRKQKKRAVLNMLKDKLRIEPVSFEEPQNLYEALRIMAQQKRKAKPEKALRFQKNTKQIEKTGKCPAECKLIKGRRSVLSNNSPKWNEDDTLDYGTIGKKKLELSHRKILQQPYITEKYSNHSLKVISFETFIPNSSNTREAYISKQRKSRGFMYESYPEGFSSEEEL